MSTVKDLAATLGLGNFGKQLKPGDASKLARARARDICADLKTELRAIQSRMEEESCSSPSSTSSSTSSPVGPVSPVGPASSPVRRPPPFLTGIKARGDSGIKRKSSRKSRKPKKSSRKSRKPKKSSRKARKSRKPKKSSRKARKSKKSSRK